MGSSYYAMEFQIKAKTRTFQWENTTIWQFITYSIIPFRFILVPKYLNLPHIPIDDSHILGKKDRYTSDLLPSVISATPEYSVVTLIAPSDSPQLLELNYDNPDTLHTITGENPCLDSMARGYCSRFHDGIRCYKNWGYIAPRVPLTTYFITVMNLS